MEKEFRLLFKGDDPSVSLFKRKMSGLPPEEIDQFYQYAYYLSLIKWKEQKEYYQSFLKRLILQDRARFLDFTDSSVLGQIRYSLSDPVMAARIINLCRLGEEQKPSPKHLAFNFLLGFNCSMKIDTLSQQISPGSFMPEELLEIYGKAQIDCGQKIVW